MKSCLILYLVTAVLLQTVTAEDKNSKTQSNQILEVHEPISRRDGRQKESQKSTKAPPLTIFEQITANGPNSAKKTGTGFAGYINDKSAKCQTAIKKVEELYPKLRECYQYTSLFFSTLETVCSEKCLDATVKASQHISEQCQFPQNSQNLADSVFHSWSNMNTATVACKKIARGGSQSHCLDLVINGNVNWMNAKYGNREAKGKLKENLCVPCAQDFYQAVSNTKHQREPVVYYRSLIKPKELYKAYEELCGYTSKPKAK
ncbi:hypothetical protein K7432_005170 [Basidiobolus ranarum]|uniref:Uncharacterized protein n=1 Tax=Basidiobolus ranarum TaxID=34480 RepID=A0ABR2W413_9FUNG